MNDQKKTRRAKEPTDSERARHLQQNQKVKMKNTYIILHNVIILFQVKVNKFLIVVGERIFRKLAKFICVK